MRDSIKRKIVQKPQGKFNFRRKMMQLSLASKMQLQEKDHIIENNERQLYEKDHTIAAKEDKLKKKIVDNCHQGKATPGEKLNVIDIRKRQLERLL